MKLKIIHYHSAKGRDGFLKPLFHLHFYQDIGQRQYQERIADIFGIFITLYRGYSDKIIDLSRHKANYCILYNTCIILRKYKAVKIRYNYVF